MKPYLLREPAELTHVCLEAWPPTRRRFLLPSSAHLDVARPTRLGRSTAEVSSQVT